MIWKMLNTCLGLPWDVVNCWYDRRRLLSVGKVTAGLASHCTGRASQSSVVYPTPPKCHYGIRYGRYEHSTCIARGLPVSTLYNLYNYVAKYLAMRLLYERTTKISSHIDLHTPRIWWPRDLDLWPFDLTIKSCHRVQCVCTKFGVDSSSRLSFTARTHPQTDIQTVASVILYVCLSVCLRECPCRKR